MAVLRTILQGIGVAWNSARRSRLFGCGLMFIVAVVVVAIVIVMTSDKSPLSLLLPAPTGTATPGPRTYTSELYYFMMTYPPTMTLLEGAGDCKGVVFSTEADGLLTRSTANPLLSVCYLEQNRQNTAAFLGDRLDKRLKLIGPNKWTDEQIGLLKAALRGKSQAPAAEQFVLGKDAVLARDVKWYEALVQYDNRLYAIEASCPYKQWETCWPVLQVMIDSLEFQGGVISSP